MRSRKKLLLILILLCFCTTLQAQVEFAHLRSKSFSGSGLGSYLNVAVPVSESAYLTLELGAYYFGNEEDNVVLIPFLAGYRQMLNEGNTGYGDESNAGFYIEPIVGYSIGGTNIDREDSTGFEITDSDGNYIEQKAKGITAGIVFGYIIPGSFPLNIGLRYEHIFVSPDPSFDMLSIRFSYAITLGRRNY